MAWMWTALIVVRWTRGRVRRRIAPNGRTSAKARPISVPCAIRMARRVLGEVGFVRRPPGRPAPSREAEGVFGKG